MKSSIIVLENGDFGHESHPFRHLVYKSLPDPQIFLDLFQRHIFCLNDHRLYPDKLENHHATKEKEDIAGRKRGDQLRKKGC